MRECAFFQTIFACLHVCVRACVRVCVRACVVVSSRLNLSPCSSFMGLQLCQPFFDFSMACAHSLVTEKQVLGLELQHPQPLDLDGRGVRV